MRCLALLVVAGCVSQQVQDDARYLTLDITSPVAFDEIEVLVSLGGPSRLASVLTPQLLALGATASPGAIFERGPLLESEVDHLSGATTEWTYQTSSLDNYFDAIVIGRSGTSVVGAVYTPVEYSIRDQAYRFESTVVLSTAAEVWGLPAPYCVRMDAAYLIGPAPFTGTSGSVSDTDCDSIPDTTDCKPDAFCDPKATDPAAMAACQCP